MESDTLCICCILRKENPAPSGRELHAGSACPRPPYWRGAAWVQAQPAARKRVQGGPARFQARLPHPRGAGGPVRFYAAHKGAEVPMGSRYVL